MHFNVKLIMSKQSVSVLLVIFFFISSSIVKADFPQAKISNGLITVKMYLPDSKNGFYRSTRFDWSGAIYSLQYKGHEYYGTWFDKIDPDVINWIYKGTEIVSGPCSALCGPVNEFQIPLGWDEAKPGEAFIKIGVGVLKKDQGNYNNYKPYEVLNSGKWTTKKDENSIEFVQELSDPKTGYAYLYHKLIRLVKGKPEMVIEHHLKNTGRLAIKSNVYNHNFVILDKQAPGPDFTFKVPFQIHPEQSFKKELAEVRGNQVVYMKPLSGEDEVAFPMTGFSNDIKDAEVIIENKKVGAGVKITVDKPLIRCIIWSIRTVLTVEPFTSIDIKPGDEFAWRNTFEYYTIPADK